KEVSEAEILDALDIAHSAIKDICKAQWELREKAGKPKVEITPPQVDEGMYNEIRSRFGAELDHATSAEDKLERQDATAALEEKIIEEFAGDPEGEGYTERRKAATLAFAKAEK